MSSTIREIAANTKTRIEQIMADLETIMGTSNQIACAVAHAVAQQSSTLDTAISAYRV